MMKPIPLWKIGIVLILFPLAYILYSLSPWSYQLFSESNGAYFILFFSGLIVIHWSTWLICLKLLTLSGWKSSDIGYVATDTKRLMGIYVLLAIGIFSFVELAVRNVGLDSEKLKAIGDFFPKSTEQRLLFIVTAFSAGFCEEFVYRGFGIRALQSRGNATWIALLITSISFTFVHGIVAFQKFQLYFLPGLLFGLLFLWRKTLTLPILVHAVIDLGAMMMVLRALNS